MYLAVKYFKSRRVHEVFAVLLIIDLYRILSNRKWFIKYYKNGNVWLLRYYVSFYRLYNREKAKSEAMPFKVPGKKMKGIK